MTSTSLAHAFAFHQAGRLAEAEAAYRRLLIEQPAESDALHLLGVVMSRLERVEDSARLIARAVRLVPTLAEGWYHLGMALQALERAEEAIAALRRAVSLRPGFVLALHRLGFLLESDGQRGAAEAVFREALAHDRSAAWLFLPLGHVLQEDGRTAEAEAFLKRALALEPAYPEALNALARAVYDQNHLEKAAVLYRRALASSPGLLSAMDGLGRTCHALGLGRKALEISWRCRAVHYGNLPPRPGPAADYDAILDRIDAAVSAHADPTDSTIYIHARTGALGHVFTEPSAVRSCRERPYERVIMLGQPRRLFPKINPRIFDVAMRGVTYVETIDYDVLNLSWRNNGAFVRGRTGYLLYDHHYVIREVFRNLRRGDTRAHVDLTAEEMEHGHAAARRMGIPEDARVVVLHLREAGFHSLVTQFSYRDATASHYHAALRYLVRQGFFVVRVGDTSMTPLPDFGPQVIDAPFSPFYDPIAEPYFIRRCHFMISSLSGPHELARGFKRPILTLNVPICSVDFPEAPGLLAFKKYMDVSGTVPRPMSFREILERDLHDTYSTYDLIRKKVQVEELSAHEILAVTREMVEFMDRGLHTDSLSSPVQSAFMTVAEAENRRAEGDWKRASRNLDWFGYATPLSRISEEYCFYHPDFLDLPT
ncbi:TIGR04372 family glycosyltransferase [Azospirillum sp. TSO22-1]|uniref:TIGR04372 family glycosyltransferase n=1 Tax=Azospirillum sp. TSO22-1 TaxID=716789 RepID=UPI000D64209F|nr:TIGR04372 family glycosyltransferase [Azospirillum sp. TSO22-1]